MKRIIGFVILFEVLLKFKNAASVEVYNSFEEMMEPSINPTTTIQEFNVMPAATRHKPFSKSLITRKASYTKSTKIKKLSSGTSEKSSIIINVPSTKLADVIKVEYTKPINTRLKVNPTEYTMTTISKVNQLSFADRKLSNEESAQTRCKCPEDLDVNVCGTDNNTYQNVCFLECSSQDQESKGLPPIFWKGKGPCTHLDDFCFCPEEGSAVCASDGKTYDNICKLNCENKRRHKENFPILDFQHKGQCIKCDCQPIVDPVCANNWKTYENTCNVDCENRKRGSLGWPQLKVSYRGRCNYCQCPSVLLYVCGTDGKTYDNSCWLQCTTFNRVSAGLTPIFLAKIGPC